MTDHVLVDDVVARLRDRNLTIAVAESLTGGLLVAELIRPAGASAVVLGGVVAYQSELKRTLLGVDGALLCEHGSVHPDVAIQLARNVRDRLAVDGRAADIGVSTTGVAGPQKLDGVDAGTVYLGRSFGNETLSRRLTLSGSRDEIRAETVAAAVGWIAESLDRGPGRVRE